MSNPVLDEDWMDENGYIPLTERFVDTSGRRWRLTKKENQTITAGGLSAWTVINAKRGGDTWVQFALIPTANPSDMWFYVAEHLAQMAPSRWGRRV